MKHWRVPPLTSRSPRIEANEKCVYTTAYYDEGSSCVLRKKTYEHTRNGTLQALFKKTLSGSKCASLTCSTYVFLCLLFQRHYIRLYLLQRRSPSLFIKPFSIIALSSLWIVFSLQSFISSDKSFIETVFLTPMRSRI